jgi:CheY-like chemotaxis protein
MDGYELARRFASHSTLRGTRLVAITGYGQEQDRRGSEAAGFVAHLVKPVDPEALRVLVETPDSPLTGSPA